MYSTTSIKSGTRKTILTSNNYIAGNGSFGLAPMVVHRGLSLSAYVVYFDQLSGAADTRKLVETFFSPFFDLFC